MSDWGPGFKQLLCIGDASNLNPNLKPAAHSHPHPNPSDEVEEGKGEEEEDVGGREGEVGVEGGAVVVSL